MGIVDWDLHHQLNKTHISNSVLKAKQIHNILPTNARLFKMNQSPTPFGSRCKQFEETNDHIITCTNSNAWMDLLKKRIITTARKNDMNITLITIIIDGIYDWRNGSNRLNELNYPEQYRPFIYDMNSIGWDQLFKMGISKRWKAFQDSKKKRRKSDMFIVCNLLWSEWKTLWYEQNVCQHGTTTIEKSKKLRSDINFKLKAIYKSRHLLLSKDQNLLYDTIEEHQEQLVFKINNRMQLFYPILKRSIRLAKSKSLNGVKNITEYFPKKENTNTAQENEEEN